MAEFIKSYPEVLILYASFITTCFVAFASYQVKAAMQEIKEGLKVLHETVQEHDKKITVLEYMVNVNQK